MASVLLPAADAQAVVEAARTWHSTLFSALLAALARLLAADTGEEDVRLLTIAAARDAPGLDQVVGLLLNPLLLRMRADGDTGFGAQMSGAADRVRATLTHAQVPVLAICEEVPDLLTVMTESQFVAVESLPPVAGLDLPGCQIHRTDPFDPDFLGTTFALPVDLLLTARPEGRTIRICALYDPAAFDDGYLRRLLDRLRAALVAGAASPGTPLAVPPDPGPLGPDPKETR
jgi:non-ribosomal peptide synthetase component F